MASNILSISVFYLVLFLVSAVICGRFPVGPTNRMKDDLAAGPNDFSIFTANNAGSEDETDVVDDGDNSFFSPDSLEQDYYEFETEQNSMPAYVTDVQINELQNAQDKISQDQEAYFLDPRCPKFDGICGATSCSSDSDCGAEGKICCYNGCTHTCIDQHFNSPPIVIDWVLLGNEKVISLPFGITATSSNGTITIPGGCKMNREQSESIELFLKYGHVTKCVCIKSDFMCYVRRQTEDVEGLPTRMNLTTW